MEDKFRIDKREIQNEMEQLEEELSRIRQSETSTKNKVLLLERQNVRLNEEAREQAENVSQLEQLNRQLRTELSKAMQPRPVEDNTQLIMWKQKVDLVVAHNKRLREKIQDLTNSQKKKNRIASEGEPLTIRWSPAFRNQVMMIRKRRQTRGDTLSDMDSEPESIFVRHRRRRLLKRKDRKKRLDGITSRLTLQDSGPYLFIFCFITLVIYRLLHKKHSSAIKYLDDSQQERGGKSEEQMSKRMEEYLIRLREDHRKEILVSRQTAGKTLADALSDQSKQLNAQYVYTFIQQYDFYWGLNIFTTKNLGLIYRTVFLEYSGLTSDISLPTSLEQYSATHSSLGIEKRPNSHHHHHPFQRSLSSVSNRCEKCEITESRLRELYHTITGDQTIVESGIEDLSSSAGSQIDVSCSCIYSKFSDFLVLLNNSNATLIL
uniref:GOLGA2L5 domain-containing protein n=1 Tax=Heterorhabditis bacteriophora TaxID=37862 RepID=A0A1I7X1D3_HETBA